MNGSLPGSFDSLPVSRSSLSQRGLTWQISPSLSSEAPTTTQASSRTGGRLSAISDATPTSALEFRPFLLNQNHQVEMHGKKKTK